MPILKFHSQIMQIYRVLDMEMKDEQNRYLIHWLGEHRQTAQWYTKPQIRVKCPSQLFQLEAFERQLAQKCDSLRSSISNPFKRTQEKQPPAKGTKEGSQQASQIKVESQKQSAQNLRRKKGSMNLRIGSDQLFNKAKGMIQKQKSNIKISSSKFKICVLTQSKQENHWAYRNFVREIVRKKDGNTYQIIWDDGKKGEANENDLLERESLKLCQFWEKKLGLIPSKRVKE